MIYDTPARKRKEKYRVGAHAIYDYMQKIAPARMKEAMLSGMYAGWYEKTSARLHHGPFWAKYIADELH